MAKTFKYGGYTFEPRGTFKDFGIKADKNEFYNISRALHYPRHPDSDKVADGDEPYDYKEFFDAAGEQVNDVFYCHETGEMYVPCGEVLPVFDQKCSGDEVRARYNRRIAERERRERFEKREALKNAMCMIDKQRDALNALREAAVACCEAGLNFAVDGTEMYAFRADLLADITDNMAPMNGQEQITSGMFLAIENAWDASEGLYANVKSES